MYAISKEENGSHAIGQLRFATWREAMNYATTANLDAPDRDMAIYGVVMLCQDEPATDALLTALKALLEAVRRMPNLLMSYPSIDTITAASDAIASAESGK